MRTTQADDVVEAPPRVGVLRPWDDMTAHEQLGMLDVAQRAPMAIRREAARAQSVLSDSPPHQRVAGSRRHVAKAKKSRIECDVQLGDVEFGVVRVHWWSHKPILAGRTKLNEAFVAEALQLAAQRLLGSRPDRAGLRDQSDELVGHEVPPEHASGRRPRRFSHQGIQYGITPASCHGRKMAAPRPGCTMMRFLRRRPARSAIGALVAGQAEG